LVKEWAPVTDVAINKKDLSERDICSEFIGPAVKRSGCDGMMQIGEEVALTKGRIIVRGKLVLPNGNFML
jgi:type I restriction enzyme R subunit